MSQWEKLLARLYNVSSDMRFEELQKILARYGYAETQPHGGSSHHTFRKSGRMPITIPVHGKIKRIYVEMIRDAVEKEREQ